MIPKFFMLQEEITPDTVLGGTGAPPAEVIPDVGDPGATPPVDSIYGDLEVKWPEGFDAQLSNEPSFKAFVNKENGEVNVANLMKSYLHTKKQMGTNKTTLPGENSTDLELDEFYEKLGYVRDEDQYTIEKGEDNVLEEDFLNKVKGFARENRLPLATANKMAKFLDGVAKEGVTTSQASQEASIKEGVDGLKAEFGQAYGHKVSLAQRVLTETIADAGILEAVKDPALGSNPAFIKALASIGEKLFKEDGLSGGNGGDMLAPAEASAKINEIMGDKSGPYFNKAHPSHNDAVKEMTRLFDLKGRK